MMLFLAKQQKFLVFNFIPMNRFNAWMQSAYITVKPNWQKYTQEGCKL